MDVLAITYGPEEGWLGVHPYYSRVLAGMMSVLESADVQLRLHAVPAQAGPEAIDAIAANATAGAVLATVTPAMATRFYRRCRRAVSLVATAESVPAIEADNVGGAFGLPDLSADGEFLRLGGYRAALELLDRDPDIDAIFVACDLMAAGAVQAITSAGRRIPDDVNVIGFDDSIAAICTNPPLSTMHLPVEKMAAAAARLLLAGNSPAGYRERFAVDFVERDSTSA